MASESIQPSLTAFVIMPFAPEFDDVYTVVQQAVHAVDSEMQVIRLDEELAAGLITEDLIKHLRESALCIADVSGANPNVMWEVGYATALNKPVVAINQKGKPLPFDIAHVRSLMYDRSSLSKTLADPLAKAVKATLDKYLAGRVRLHRSEARRWKAIAVTGSTWAPPARAADRISRTLAPYLGKDYQWYVGSNGSVDETAVKYLLDQGEASIAVVGYTSYDISERMLSLIADADAVTFIDPSTEQVPIAAGAPSARDVLFAARSDFLILVWDGRSYGTGELVEWLGTQGKDHLVSYFPSELYTTPAGGMPPSDTPS
jgi:hypothetical protein